MSLCSNSCLTHTHFMDHNNGASVKQILLNVYNLFCGALVLVKPRTNTKERRWERLMQI
jgi:hypothetical protein